MFGMMKSALKAASAVVDIPVGIAADAVTMGGVLNDKETSYTAEAAARFVKNVKDITE